MLGAPLNRRRIAPGLGRKAGFALLIAAAVVVPACSLNTAAQPPAQAALIGSPSDAARAIDLARALAARDRGLDSMQTPAVMEYSTPQHHLKVREDITVRRPHELRIEAISSLGVEMVLTAKGSQLTVFRSSDNTLMRGAATADTLNRFARVPLAPKPAVDLLMGLAPDADLLANATESVRTEDGMLIGSYRSRDGSGLELGFLGGQLALVRGRLDDGRVSYEIRYDDFRDIGGLMMAYRVDADFPLAQSHVKFRLQRPIVNGIIADSMFELSPGPKTREIDIDLDHQALSSAGP
jgi:hypothetical protein